MGSMSMFLQIAQLPVHNQLALEISLEYIGCRCRCNSATRMLIHSYRFKPTKDKFKDLVKSVFLHILWLAVHAVQHFQKQARILSRKKIVSVSKSWENGHSSTSHLILCIQVSQQQVICANALADYAMPLSGISSVTQSQTFDVTCQVRTDHVHGLL